MKKYMMSMKSLIKRGLTNHENRLKLKVLAILYKYGKNARLKKKISMQRIKSIGVA